MKYQESITYDPDTGLFTWPVGRPGCKKGSVAGAVNAYGYLVVCVKRKRFLAHRLAWFMSYGSWPEGDIDHMNGNKLDNRLANLRVVDHSMNMQNKRSAQSNNKSCGLLGVTWQKSCQRWRASIMANKRQHYLGHYKTPEEAHQVYLEAKRRLHPGCTI